MFQVKSVNLQGVRNVPACSSGQGNGFFRNVAEEGVSASCQREFYSEGIFSSGIFSSGIFFNRGAGGNPAIPEFR